MKYWKGSFLHYLSALSCMAILMVIDGCGGTGGCSDCARQEVQINNNNKPGNTPSCGYYGIWPKATQTTFSCGVPTYRSSYNDCRVQWQTRTIDRSTCLTDCYYQLWNDATGEFVSGISDQEDPQDFFLKSGPCVGPVVEIPSTPENLVFTAPNTLTWNQSRKNKAGSGTNPPDMYMVVWDAGTIDQAKFETLRTKTAGADQQAISVTPSTLATQTVDLPVSGDFYVRVRAENANGNSELSDQIKVTVVGTGSIVFTPRIIPKTGVERVKMVVTGDVFATDMKLKINGTEITYERDQLADNIVYFTPPVPGTTSSFQVVLENHPTTGSTLTLGTQKLVVAGMSDPSDAFQSILAGARVRLEENFSIIKKKMDDGGYTSTPDFPAATLPANELLQVAFSELRNTQFYVDDFIFAYAPFGGATMDQTQSDLEAFGAENGDYLAARIEDLAGPIQTDPVLAKTGAESGYWGQADFFSHYIQEMKANGKDYIDGQLPDLSIFEIKWVLIRASAYQLDFQTYNTAGKTILNAALDNPSARLIMNGAMFGPRGADKKPIPFKISGQMWIDCVEPSVSSHVGEPGYNRGKTLWNFVQKADLSYGFGHGNPPPPPNTACNTPGTTKTGTGGLYAFNIGPNGAPLRYIDDPNLTKLQNYSFGKYYTPTAAKNVAASFAGFAGIAHYTDPSDNEEYLLAFSKEQWMVKSLPARLYWTHTLWDIQNDLSKMKVEWAIGVDGGPVTAMAFNDGTSLKTVVRSYDHWGTRPDDLNTTPSYVVFK